MMAQRYKGFVENANSIQMRMNEVAGNFDNLVEDDRFASIRSWNSDMKSLINILNS